MALNPFDAELEDQQGAGGGQWEAAWEALEQQRQTRAPAAPTTTPTPASPTPSTPNAPSQWEAAWGALEKQRAAALRTVASTVDEVDPDRRAQHLRMAQATGLPVDVVERNPDEAWNLLR